MLEDTNSLDGAHMYMYVRPEIADLTESMLSVFVTESG